MRSMGSRGGLQATGKTKLPETLNYILLTSVGILIGYSLGYLALDLMFGTGLHMPVVRDQTTGVSGTAGKVSKVGKVTPTRKWPGDTIHSVVTSSGDPYQNFQTRIMYKTYQMVQQEPGGEKMTAFTRILHRSVPDVLMRIIPTWHAWDVLKPECDGWCDYPVANRPLAIQQWVEAASKNESMIQGAWVLMLECDYVWMSPATVPGDAYDASVPGVQFYYDYITPQWHGPWMKKLFDDVNVGNIPASGPAPVMLRFKDWQVVAPDYRIASARMEADKNMTNALGWVREMYAWDVAIARREATIKVVTNKYPDTTLIVQPPFDNGMGKAVLCHYTWGALYHEGGSTKGPQIYRWEKRDFNDMKYVIQVPEIPMPPPYKDGLTLEFEAPLTRPRHDLVVLMLTQMNKAIKELPNIQDELDHLEQHVLPEFQEWRKTVQSWKERQAEVQATTAAKSARRHLS